MEENTALKSMARAVIMDCLPSLTLEQKRPIQKFMFQQPELHEDEDALRELAEYAQRCVEENKKTSTAGEKRE